MTIAGNVSNVGGRSNDVLQAIAKLTLDKEGNVVSEIENGNPKERMNEHLENNKKKENKTG